jgi:NAD-dependent DNA ligase
MDIQELQKTPIKILENTKKKDIITFLENCDHAFFNTGSTLVSDDLYDIVKDYVREKYPKDKYLQRVGADEAKKVKLPFYMGSQDKIRDSEKDIEKFIKKYAGPYVISEKLDGISCLVYHINNDIKIYTRGNGKEGQDISYIKDYISIPKISIDKLAVRGELIINRKNWEKIKHLGSNARNVVAGALNAKIINKEIIEKIEFIAYDVMYPRKKLDEALEHIRTFKYNIVKYIKVNNLTLELLSNTLQDWRKNSNYEIDGIVISDNNAYDIIAGKNPEYSFAFKSIHTHNQVEVIVTDVEWNVSKDKYLKPIVKFNEVNLNGVNIKQATGFNANYIDTNKIGPGSRIIIIRSGDVIPHILSVLTPSANNKPSMPDVEYKWNDTHIDILLEGDTKNRDHDIKEFIYFMKTLDISNMGPGTITKLYDAGFDTLKKIINIKYEELLKIEGFKETSSKKLIESLKKINDCDCLVLMDASNIMGRGYGYRKLKAIIDKYPFILNISDKEDRKRSLKLRVDDLTKVDLIAELSAILFIENLPKFYKFYDELGIKCSNKNDTSGVVAATNINQNIKDKNFVFSGFRNKEYEKYIIDNKGFVMQTVSSGTNYLIVSDINDNSSKIIKAKSLNIPIISKDDFEKTFMK